MNSQLWLGNVRNLVYSYIPILTAILRNDFWLKEHSSMFLDLLILEVKQIS